MGFLHRLILRFYYAWQGWRDDDGHFMAAAVAYHGGLSLFPVLIILFSGLGFFLSATFEGVPVKEQLIHVIAEQLSPQLQEQLEQILGHVENKAVINAPLGVLGLLLVSLALFGQFDRAFDRIWKISPDPPSRVWGHVRKLLLHRLQAFLLLLFMGAVLLVNFLTSMVLSTLQSETQNVLPYNQNIWWTIQWGSILTINALVFTSLYKWMPKRYVSWWQAAQGGVVASLIWEGGRQILAFLLVGTRLSNAYGLIGSFLAIMLWGYFACAVVFFGAEFILASAPERRRRAAIQPPPVNPTGESLRSATDASPEDVFPAASTTNDIAPPGTTVDASSKP